MSETERTIVVGVDYSDQSVFAVDEALRAAESIRGTRLVAVLVLPAGTTGSTDEAADLTRELVERASENLTQLLAARARALGVNRGAIEARVRFGAPAEQLLGVSRELGAVLIAVGTHGRSGLSQLLLGSVAEEVMRKASCSVLIARSPEPHAEKRSDAPYEDAARLAEAGVSERSEPTVVAGPHIDAGRVVLHVLDVPSGQVFVSSFESELGVSVEPLGGSWVPAPSSAARARVARVALRAAASDRALFSQLFEEIAQRRSRAHDA